MPELGMPEFAEGMAMVVIQYRKDRNRKNNERRKRRQEELKRSRLKIQSMINEVNALRARLTVVNKERAVMADWIKSEVIGDIPQEVEAVCLRAKGADSPYLNRIKWLDDRLVESRACTAAAIEFIVQHDLPLEDACLPEQAFSFMREIVALSMINHAAVRFVRACEGVETVKGVDEYSFAKRQLIHHLKAYNSAMEGDDGEEEGTEEMGPGGEGSDREDPSASIQRVPTPGGEESP